ncbi:MAG TPA: zinc-ribbon domain-containing protein [Bacillota bacterium]|nr:zinc-ribbon domain-containing protein [Bacillota bacterium]
MEELFKRIKQEIDKGITVVSVKSKELIDAARINTQIAELNESKSQTLKEIGVIVYRMSCDKEFKGDGEIAEKCRLVGELEQQIEEKELELKKLHTDTQEAIGKTICESCGAVMEENAKFCSSCGARLVKVEK